MKVLLVNTYDTGGAAKACVRLHDGLLQEGIESNVLFRSKISNLKDGFEFRRDCRLRCRLLFLIKKFRSNRVLNFKLLNDFIDSRSNELEYVSFPNSDFDITETIQYQEADIIHLHWVADFLDWGSFFRKNTKPLIWTLHDENPFSGCEHYAERYQGIDNFGFPIPRIYSDLEMAVSEYLSNYKSMTIKSASNIHIVCPSTWILRKSQESKLFSSRNHSVIANGFPAQLFRPLNKLCCKEIFGLDSTKRTVLFLADNLSNKRKGLIFLKRLIECSEYNELAGLEFCAVGDEEMQFNESSGIKYLGKILDDRLLSIVYNAADVFILPSLEDNLPNTMIESLLCGTPVIGFPVGGIVETIDNGFNGIVCDDISVESLRRAMLIFINGEHKFDPFSISSDACLKYDLKIQTLKYIELYTKILKHN